MVAWDNTFLESRQGVNDLYHDAQHKWIDHDTGIAQYKTAYDNNNRFDYQQPVTWITESGTVDNGMTYRDLNYQLQAQLGTQVRSERHHRHGTLQPPGICYGQRDRPLP